MKEHVPLIAVNIYQTIRCNVLVDSSLCSHYHEDSKVQYACNFLFIRQLATPSIYSCVICRFSAHDLQAMSTLLEWERADAGTCYRETKTLRLMRDTDAVFYVPRMQWGKGLADQ